MGLVGKKCGMSRIFTQEGHSIPVTVILVEPNWVTQVKTEDKDGYSAVQVTTGQKKNSALNKPQAGHFAKAGVEAGVGLWEFRTDSNHGVKVGDECTVSIFSEGQKLDIIGKSKGKGFQGTVKRWNFHMQDATHGNSLSHRAPGSIGQCQTPGRVWKGKKMSGQMGNERVTMQSLEIVAIHADKQILMVRGGIPGAIGSMVVLKPAVKSQKPVATQAA